MSEMPPEIKAEKIRQYNALPSKVKEIFDAHGGIRHLEEISTGVQPGDISGNAMNKKRTDITPAMRSGAAAHERQLERGQKDLY